MSGDLSKKIGALEYLLDSFADAGYWADRWKAQYEIYKKEMGLRERYLGARFGGDKSLVDKARDAKAKSYVSAELARWQMQQMDVVEAKIYDEIISHYREQDEGLANICMIKEQTARLSETAGSFLEGESTIDAVKERIQDYNRIMPEESISMNPDCYDEHSCKAMVLGMRSLIDEKLERINLKLDEYVQRKRKELI